MKDYEILNPDELSQLLVAAVERLGVVEAVLRDEGRTGLAEAIENTIVDINEVAGMIDEVETEIMEVEME